MKPAKGESLQAAGRGPEEASGRRAVEEEKRAMENRKEGGAPEHAGEKRAGAALQWREQTSSGIRLRPRIPPFAHVC